MRINVSINMLFGIAACYSRESAPANADYFGRNTVINLFALEMPPRKSMRSIADNLSKADWSWGWVSAIDSNGRTIWIADAHRNNGKRLVVHAQMKS